MSSCLGGVSIKCPLTVEYCLGLSLPGSPLFHSFLLNASAPSSAAKLGVIHKIGSCVESKMVCPTGLLACCNIW